jgi:FkbM family methyltransferase
MPSARLGDYTVFFGNSDEYHHLKQELFTHHSYYVELDNPSPLILDLGAHIGLAMLYFKQLYPNAKVVAVEPLPANLEYLRQNINANNLQDVIVVPKAVTSHVGSAELYFDASGLDWWSTAGFTRGAWNRAQKSDSIMVETTTLAELLEQHQTVDILKVDIEGAEYSVFANTPPALLKRVQHCFVEYHPTKEHSLEVLLDRLQKGFKDVSVTSTEKSGLTLIEASNP